MTPPAHRSAEGPGAAVALVLAPNGSQLRAGDLVEGMLGWQEYAVAPGRELRKIDPRLAPISTALGVLGMPGLTAYFGLLDIGDPQPGETVVGSGAAGAVGTIVGQIAKIQGSRVVGVAGSASWLNAVETWFSQLGRRAIHRGMFNQCRRSQEGASALHRSP